MRTRMSGAAVQAAMGSRGFGRLTIGLTVEHDDWEDDLTIRDVPVGGGGGV